MKRVIELLRGSGVMAAARQLLKKKSKKDDDWFDHPFAIF